MPLSDAFQKLELQQQRNVQDVIDALQHGINFKFFEEILLQQAKAIQDSNVAEHEQTRVILVKTHSETLDQLRQGSDAAQRTTVDEAGRTRDLITVRHEDSRAQSSNDHGITRTSITSAHDATRAQVTGSINGQIAATEGVLADDQRRTVDFLEAELFRANLENEVMFHREQQHTRDAIHDVSIKAAVQAAGLRGAIALVQRSAVKHLTPERSLPGSTEDISPLQQWYVF